MDLDLRRLLIFELMMLNWGDQTVEFIPDSRKFFFGPLFFKLEHSGEKAIPTDRVFKKIPEAKYESLFDNYF